MRSSDQVAERTSLTLAQVTGCMIPRVVRSSLSVPGRTAEALKPFTIRMISIHERIIPLHCTVACTVCIMGSTEALWPLGNVLSVYNYMLTK
jgi:hypothetical protein